MSEATKHAAELLPGLVEDIEVQGHIIDSLILPKILDCICAHGATFHIQELSIGRQRDDPSRALVQVRASTPDQLQHVLAEVAHHGAVPVVACDCRFETADADGVFPEGFYSTTNQRTEIRMNGRWVPVSGQGMDCGITIDASRGAARCVVMDEVKSGDPIAVGHGGVRVFPEERPRETHPFGFMGSKVSTEKPKGAAIRQIARELAYHRATGGRTAVVAGPAVVHTGSGEFLCELIRRGYVDLLLAGNALATHDIEQSMFGTSLGVYLARGAPAEHGHEHHLRAINRIRRAGGIRRAVEDGVLTSGIMAECIRRSVDFLLAGSIRDDGPLPDVVTDVMQAKRLMREKLRDVTLCLMMATTLHAVAVANLLPAWVKVVCVDINPSTAIKLADRGSFQTISLVTDVAPFLRALVEELSSTNDLSRPAEEMTDASV
jgi:lysine-ketoglutarate reductase/saccharopine dehydrogenase-like protein (TIGR00300 family)